MTEKAPTVHLCAPCVCNPTHSGVSTIFFSCLTVVAPAGKRREHELPSERHLPSTLCVSHADESYSSSTETFFQLPHPCKCVSCSRGLEGHRTSVAHLLRANIQSDIWHPAPRRLIKPLNATRLTRLCLCFLIKQTEPLFLLTTSFFGGWGELKLPHVHSIFLSLPEMKCQRRPLLVLPFIISFCHFRCWWEQQQAIFSWWWHDRKETVTGETLDFIVYSSSAAPIRNSGLLSALRR